MSTRRRSAARRYLAFFPLILPTGLALQAGCGDTITTYNSYYYVADGGEAGETSEPPGTAGAAGHGGEGGQPPDDAHLAYPDAPYADTSVAEHDIDVFGVFGNRYWFGVSAEQLELLNEGTGVGPVFDGPFGDPYSPGGPIANFADHLWVTSAGPSGGIADYGKVQVKLAGQSTLRPWTKRSIPSFNIDTNEFVEKQRLGGFEHLRFNNAQVGGIFREWLALELYRELDYPAPLATFAWVSSNVWASGVEVPYVLVERYKRSFCARGDAFGGSCANMWEFQGDIGPAPDPNGEPLPVRLGRQPSVFDDPNNCQFSECDDTRARQLEQLLYDTPLGDGFKAATEELIDWSAFHRFQCLSWVLATGDDALHNTNNVVLAERADGKFQFLPYSVDFSLGNWHTPVPLAGTTSSIARGCQSDQACWADTIATCEDVLTRFQGVDPVAMVDRLYEALEEQGMLRSGDDRRYEDLRAWLEERLVTLPEELEANREGPVPCAEGTVDCGNGICAPPGACGLQCKPRVGKAALADDPDACPLVTTYPM